MAYSFPMLHPRYLLKQKPTPKLRPVLDMTDATTALILERAADLHAIEFRTFHNRMLTIGYSWQESHIMEDRAKALHQSGLDIHGSDALQFIANPTEEEWAETEAERVRVYEDFVDQAIRDATAASNVFCLLSVDEMAVYYAGRPDKHIWSAITAPLVERVRDNVEYIGDCIIDEEEARLEEKEYEHRGF